MNAPRSRSTIHAFEGARGVAALLVALYHFALLMPFRLPYPLLVRYGYLFVDLFFVLSGYVICSAYADRVATPDALRAFVIRRFGRLFPLLVFASAAWLLVPNLHALAKTALVALGHAGLFAAPGAHDYALPSFAEALATLTMTHGLGLFDHAILDFTSWSISTEFYTYLLFAAVCALTSGRARLAAFAVASGVAFGITCWASVVPHHCASVGDCMNVTYDFGFARCIASFFLGCLTCKLAPDTGRYAGRVQALALLGIGALLMAADRAPLAAFAGPAIFALWIAALSSDRGPVARLLNTLPAQLLGQRSYSIYLMHPVLIEVFGLAVRHAASRAAGLVALIAYVAALIALSGLTYRFIEAPGRDCFNRIARRRVAVPESSTLIS